MARGFVKNVHARWPLEEIGRPHRVRRVESAGGEESPEPLADQPFGQIPVYREAGLTLFESDAILIHLVDKDDRLLPRDPAQRACAIGWMIAALNNVESTTQMPFALGYRATVKEWREEAKAAARPFAKARLSRLSNFLGEREWLEESFTIGELLMIDVLRAVSEPDLVAAHPNLAAHLARGVARPAFERAVAAHLAELADALSQIP